MAWVINKKNGGSDTITFLALFQLYRRRSARRRASSWTRWGGSEVIGHLGGLIQPTCVQVVSWFAHVHLVPHHMRSYFSFASTHPQRQLKVLLWIPPSNGSSLTPPNELIIMKYPTSILNILSRTFDLELKEIYCCISTEEYRPQYFPRPPSMCFVVWAIATGACVVAFLLEV